MKLNGLLDLGQSIPGYQDLLATLRAGERVATPLAVYHAARPYLVGLLARALQRPILVVTARSGRARQWVDELRIWLPDEIPVQLFADPDALIREAFAHLRARKAFVGGPGVPGPRVTRSGGPDGTAHWSLDDAVSQS